jgi:endonuclease/exonuclease/phosphatase (EEP) superfamily protein YafD
MTYNAGAGHTTPEALVRLIGESDADIVGLQEIGDFHVAAIERELGAEYSYRVLYGYGLAAGIGLMSRYPILHHEQFSGTYDFLPFLRVVIDYHGQPITIIVVHPPMPLLDRAGYHIRSDYDFAVFSQMAQDGQPTLLIGDLNTTDRSDQYRRLKAAGLDDAFREMGIGFGHTWPTTGRYPPIPLPLIRIDYIWYNAHFRVARAWVGPDSGSDHLPVLADLVWATGGR